ncbi:fibronectin type III domain-containing protein [Phycicoccus sp. MAQZ13P-2]|uniref:fibronectin type III domain-containing protein n=1 Tax=Phycicoccus mangrovi TaxID=2840470 RepID=UPI001C008616|nr:fibronectin type III domain-containing protein [Phycicoccus mangrovi]MBT9254908.1 fibronectin type III domain-containing protein [Phycicoccus mangrovi]MBT9256095.1 fibronectin type III domain-containing protein [Phycicoccus mangrovi]MBT9273892.1 fibronectin type III domain-containing protein [Phycicoccus mangrovi]
MRTTRRLGLLLTTLLVTLLVGAPTGALAAPTVDAPPGPVTGLSLLPQRTSVALGWTLPTDADLAEVVVRRLPGTTAPATPTDGTQVASGLISRWSDLDLDWVGTWSYSVFARDAAGQWSPPASVTGAALDLSTSTVVATPASRSITLSWRRPLDARPVGMRIAVVDCADAGTVLRTVDVALPTTSWVDGGLAPTTRSCYEARSYDVDGRLRRVPQRVTATTLPVDPVSGLTATAGTTSVRLDWTLPTDPAPSAVVVRRVGDDGVRTAIHRGLSTTFTDTGLDVERSYSYSVAAVSDAGAESPAREVTARTTVGWAHATLAPPSGGPQDVECPRTTWCMVLDRSSSYLVRTSTGWSAPVTMAPGTSQSVTWHLSCPVVGWCLAVGEDGAHEYTRGAWRSAADTPQPPVGTEVRSLTCTSPTWCVALTTGPRATVFDGTRWSTPQYLSSLRATTFFDVACQAAGRCVAVGESDGDGSAWRATLVGGRWSTAKLDGPGRSIRQVECPTSSWCIASGAYGTWTVSGTTWSARHEPTLANADTALACASVSTCVGLDGWLRPTRWTGRGWASVPGPPIGNGMVADLSCPRGATPCVAVDDRGREHRWSLSGGWRTEGVFDPTAGYLTEVSCASETDCLAFDFYGWSYRFDGTGWRRPSQPFRSHATADCAPTGFCLAVDDAGHYRTLSNDNRWSPLRSAPRGSYLRTPSCSSATSCLALDMDGRAWRWTGSSIVAAGAPFTGLPYQGSESEVRCTAASWCMATALDGWWSVWNGRSWSTPRTLPASLTRQGTVVLDCASARMCLAVVGIGTTARWDGSSWTVVPGQDIGPGTGLSDISCVTDDWCLGVHPYTNASAPVQWRGAGWSGGTRYGRDTQSDVVDCPSTTVCVVAGSQEVTWSRRIDPPPVG